jgi:hypothetical protein
VSAAPKLRDDLTIVEQTYRGEQSYIVKDPKTRKYYRFRPVEVQVLQQFDGVRSAAEVAADLTEAGLRVPAATVDKFATKLKSMGLLAPNAASGSRPAPKATSSEFAGPSATPISS